MVRAKLIVNAAEPIGVISPNLYGYFFENCGESIYPGLWASADSRLANEEGLRTDVMDALAALGPCAIRWPGGWYANFHHWRDGVGPRQQRPVNVVPAKWDAERKRTGGLESNAFGTNEYMRFCRRIGAEPYVCVNMATGTAGEAHEWVEYCNYDGDSTLARLRAEHGHPQPHAVRYWNLGNEPHTQPEMYAAEITRYAHAMARAAPNQGIEMVASTGGPDQIEWHRRLLTALGVYHVHHLSLHHYAWGGGFVVDFTDEQYYAQMASRFVLEQDLADLAGIADALCGHEGRKLGLVVDEWGRHGDAGDRMWMQLNTFREAMLSAVNLNTFNQHADRMVMACVSHMINVGQCLIYANEQGMFLTPNYYVWQMYKPHKGATAVSVREESPVLCEDPLGMPADKRLARPLHALCASASINESTGSMTATFVNQSLTDAMELEIQLRDGGSLQDGTLTVLVSQDVRDINTWDNPDVVKPPQAQPVKCDGPALTVKVPAHSISALAMNLS